MVCGAFVKRWMSELIRVQDSIDFCSIVLDDASGPLDSMEDPRHQGRPLMGLANKTGHHCWVCLFSAFLTQITYILASLPGTPLWIAFTYSNMNIATSVNRFFAPAGW